MKNAALLGLVAILLVVTLNPAAAITNGHPDEPAHQYVGLVVFDDAPGHAAWRCSGSLISPTVLVTAGHCTDGAVAARVWFNPTVALPYVTDYPSGGVTAVEGTPITHPDFCIGCGPGLVRFDTHDVGVVILNTPVALAEYASLPTLGQVDGLSMGTEVTLVGYGVSEQTRGIPPHRWIGPRTRMYAPTRLVASNDLISGAFIKLTANPAQGKGGTCFGDSGGPDLLAGTNTILAVNSFVTNGNCAGVTYSNRIDTAYALSFINSFLP